VMALIFRVLPMAEMKVEPLETKESKVSLDIGIGIPKDYGNL